MFTPATPHATPLKVGVNIIFINCLRRGIFPEIWKHANVVPVHKKKEKNVKENYRPISLLPIFGKIPENSYLTLCILISFPRIC